MSMTKLTRREWPLINWRAVRHYLGDQLFEVAASLVRQAERNDVSLDDTTIVVTLRLASDQQSLADSLINQAIAGRNLKSRFLSNWREVADGWYFYKLNLRDYEPFRLERPVVVRRRCIRFSTRHA